MLQSLTQTKMMVSSQTDSIEMAHLYSAGGSFHPLRQKHDQTANTKCRKVELRGEMGN